MRLPVAGVRCPSPSPSMQCRSGPGITTLSGAARVQGVAGASAARAREPTVKTMIIRTLGFSHGSHSHSGRNTKVLSFVTSICSRWCVERSVKVWHEGTCSDLILLACALPIHVWMAGFAVVSSAQSLCHPCTSRSFVSPPSLMRQSIRPIVCRKRAS